MNRRNSMGRGNNNNVIEQTSNSPFNPYATSSNAYGNRGVAHQRTTPAKDALSKSMSVNQSSMGANRGV